MKTNSVEFFCTISCSWFIAVLDLLFYWSCTEQQPSINEPKTRPCTTELALHTAAVYLFWQSNAFTNPVFRLRIFFLVIGLSQRMSHYPRKQYFDNDSSFNNTCTKYAWFGAESKRSRAAILSKTCPVVCGTMLGCVQVDSVVWKVIRADVVLG